METQESIPSGHPRDWLANLTLPVIALLEFQRCPTVLWSHDRNECVFNTAAKELVGVSDSDIRVGADLWLDCMDARDRERFLSSWQTLRGGDGKMVCNYRFVPRGTIGPVDLQETARRLPPGPSGKMAVLSWYQLREPRARRESSSMRALLHQIGNSLQSVRGEVDLLRLLDALPQRSFEKIVQGIEDIRELTARLDGAGKTKRQTLESTRQEVRNGRT